VEDGCTRRGQQTARSVRRLTALAVAPGGVVAGSHHRPGAARLLGVAIASHHTTSRSPLLSRGDEGLWQQAGGDRRSRVPLGAERAGSWC
jgi:hypothetical protein